MKHLFFFLCLLALTACSQASPSATTLPPTVTLQPPAATPPPTSTPTPFLPTATATPVLPTATDLPLPGVLDEQPYVNETYAFQVAYPTGWQPVEMGDIVILLADLSAISTNTPTQAVTISAGPLETFLGGMLVGVGLDGAGAVLQALVPQLMGPGIQLGQFETLTVGDLPAIGAPLDGEDETGIPIEGYVALLLTGQRAAILLASAPAGEWAGFAPTFTAMLDTFAFTIP